MASIFCFVGIICLIIGVAMQLPKTQKIARLSVIVIDNETKETVVTRDFYGDEVYRGAEPKPWESDMLTHSIIIQTVTEDKDEN